MEQIRQLMHILIPLLPQCGPLYVLVLIDLHRIVLFLDGISEIIPSGYGWEQRGFYLILFVRVGFPPVLDMGVALRSAKIIFSRSEKSWTEKYPSSKFNHLSTASASIFPSNIGMSKFTCTLKGVAPPEWLLDADAPYVGSRWRIWAKLSIIAFLCFSRASSSSILIGYPAPLSFFSSTKGGYQGLRGWSCKGSTSLISNTLYPWTC